MRDLSGIVVLSVAILTQVGPRASESQRPSLNCAREPCEITLTKLVTLSGNGHPGLEGPNPFVVQDRLGRFFVRAAKRPQVIAFDATGRFLALLETADQSARAILLSSGPRSSVVAWTAPAGQAFEIGQSLKVTPWPSPVPYPPAFIREDGTIIIAQQIQTRDLLGYPLHLIASDGRVLRSFGTDTPQYRPDLRLLMDYIAAPAADGTVWTSPRGRYTIERWNPTTGARLARVPVKSPWFVESVNYPTDGHTRPKPIIVALWEREGLLWVLIRDADPEWQPITDPERPWESTWYNAQHDWVLEVVDPTSARVLVSRRFGSALWGRPPQPFVVSFAATQAGEPAGLDVWKPELRRKELE